MNRSTTHEPVAPLRSRWTDLSVHDDRNTHLYNRILAAEGDPGRPATDPAVLLAVWLYATVDGVGSARRVDALCRQHDVYRWICGGVPMNYHTLADFRTTAGGFTDELLATSLAALLKGGLVKFDQVAQDGLKVRASAGAGSFHREQNLASELVVAEARIEKLRKELDENPSDYTNRERAARERAARERKERLAQAIAAVPGIKSQRQKHRGEKYDEPPDPPPPSPGPPAESTATEASTQPELGVEPRSQRNDGVREVRVSTTDPAARVMKMADGGFRPAYNIQIASSLGTSAILSFEVTNSGGDQPTLEPMVDRICAMAGKAPTDWVCDGGFVNLRTIERIEDRGITAPPPRPKKGTDRTRYDPGPKDTEVIVEWRRRMASEEARKLYALRGPTAEWVNAQIRNFGLFRLMVRGIERVKGVVLMYAMAHNMRRTLAMM